MQQIVLRKFDFIIMIFICPLLRKNVVFVLKFIYVHLFNILLKECWMLFSIHPPLIYQTHNNEKLFSLSSFFFNFIYLSIDSSFRTYIRTLRCCTIMIYKLRTIGFNASASFTKWIYGNNLSLSWWVIIYSSAVERIQYDGYKYIFSVYIHTRTLLFFSRI